MDLVKEDMRMVSVTEEEASVRVRWRPMIRCGEQLSGRRREAHVIRHHRVAATARESG